MTITRKHDITVIAALNPGHMPRKVEHSIICRNWLIESETMATIKQITLITSNHWNTLYLKD